MEPAINNLGKSFTRLLIEDVLDAYDRVAKRDDEGSRRHVVRTIFAAIEGEVWMCREHVRQTAAAMGYLTPLADLALREQNYSVTEAGEVVEQTRYVTLTASIRLTVKQAMVLAPGLLVDFGGHGWQQLKQALAVRHRITHPKQTAHLVISEDDLATARIAFEWVLAVVTEVMGAIISAQAEHSRDMRELLEQLKAGDPAALQAYRDALAAAPD